MTHLENAVSVTIVRLGKAVSKVFFPSAVDGKMKSTALEKNTTASASPRRTIVLSLAKANSVILESPERDVKRPFLPKSSTVLGGTHCGTGEAVPLFV